MRRLLTFVFLGQLKGVKSLWRKTCRHLPSFGQIWELLQPTSELLQYTTAKAGMPAAEM